MKLVIIRSLQKNSQHISHHIQAKILGFITL